MSMGVCCSKDSMATGSTYEQRTDILLQPPWRLLSSREKVPDFLQRHDDVYYGYVHRKGSKLWFTSLTFGQIGVGLPAMIANLESEGCIDIEYTIQERDSWDVYEEG